MVRSPRWPDDLAREPAVRRLVRALSLSRRFHFYIVTCKAPPVVDALISVVRRETAAARGGEPEIRRIDPYAAHEDFTRPMEPRSLTAHVTAELLAERNAEDSAITLLDATLASPEDDPAWKRLFGRMNERRNAIVAALRRELLLCLPPRLDDMFKAAAPDFWSIRSGEYELNSLPPAGGAIEAPLAPEDAVVLERSLHGAGLALDEGNEALRRRDGEAALAAFGRMRVIAGALLAEDPTRAEHVEMAERASLGMGRASLLMGDVAGAAEAWGRVHDEALRAAGERASRGQMPAAPQASATESFRPPEVFISYAPEDERLVRELETHLAPLELRGMFRTWHQGHVVPGEAWDQAVADHLRTAAVVLLMISASFLASERAQLEMERALRLAEESGTRIVPVILRPCAWQYSPVGRLQPLPRSLLPISAWSDRDEAWAELTKEIARVLTSGPSRKR